MDVDLETASREELIGLIRRLLERVPVLEARLHELEAARAGEGKQLQGLQTRVQELEAENGRLRRETEEKGVPSWVKSNRPTKEKKERQKRAQGYARRLDKPTHRAEHAYSECPDCHTPLQGGRVGWRRQVITLPRLRVRVTEHVFIERQCSRCGRVWVPKADQLPEVVGQQRMGLSVQSEVATLREESRLPFGVIQGHLERRYGLHLSVGELVGLVQGFAERGKGAYQALQEEVRGSPVVHGDETGWREDGRNGYLWSFSTPKVRYFLYRHSRGGAVVQEVLGEEFDGVLVSDFYKGYNVHAGLHQRCWTHLLRDIHELKERHAQDEAVAAWAKGVRGVYDEAKAYGGPDPKRPLVEQERERTKKQRELEGKLWVLCEPHVRTEAPMSILCERVEMYLPELFMFVADPRVPADNNAAERSLRGPVVSRQISGGTRSPLGSETKSILASLFGTWRLQGRNLYESCREILTSPKATPSIIPKSQGPSP